MKKRRIALTDRIQRIAKEIEGLLPEVKAAVGEGMPPAGLMAGPARTLERAATAIRVVVDEHGTDAGSELRDILSGTSPLMAIIGSRVVLTGQKESRQAPSAGAQALALLLEHPEQTFDAGEIAERLGVSVPAARTTLNRLVQSGHATRKAKGQFKAA